ncbi:MAG: GNAT family N-acetyltransferase [Arenimonas sp.]
MNLNVSHDTQGHRFHVDVEGSSCVLDYRLGDSIMTITHTGVPAELGGRGIAAQLMTAALHEARSKRWKVVPACSYAAAFMAKHPEFEDLRA